MPFQVFEDAVKGRVLRASRDIKALEAVLWDSTTLAAPHPMFLRCISCLSVQAARCQCGLAICDDPTCRDDQVHSRLCPQREWPVATLSKLVLPLKLMLSEENWVIELQSHVDTWRQRDGLISCQALDLGGDLTKIETMMGVVKTNAVGVGPVGSVATCNAVFRLFSLLSHDCRPNCHYATEVTPGGAQDRCLAKVLVRAKRPIAKGARALEGTRRNSLVRG